MRVLRTYALILLFISQATILFGGPFIKHVGTPIIRQYKRVDFSAGRQTWMIEQGQNGMMYFANNDGLLEFDGKQWTVYPLPNRTIVRCVRSDGQGRIFVGGFNEFGYFSPDDKGKMQYQSLVERVPEEKRDLGEVWKIHFTPNGIIFQSFLRIVAIREEGTEIIDAPDQFHFSYYVTGELYVIDRKEGLMRLAMGKLFSVVGTERLKGKEVWGMMPYEDELLIVTDGHGIFTYDGSQLSVWARATSDHLCENKVFCAKRIGDSFIAFGTIQNGLYITDLQGNILQAINRQQGLQNNTVLCMNTDAQDNLWLGLDNGIDYLETNSPLSLLSYHHGLSSGYAAAIHKGMLYLGTNQGVYATEWEKYNSSENNASSFKLVENTGGQVWVLQVIDGQLFCGHNNGTFLINGYTSRRISEINGGWKYLQIASAPEKVIAGTYSGFILFEKQEDEWYFSRRIKGFDESSRDFFGDDDKSIWMSHGLKGVYRLGFNENYDSVASVDFYNSSTGLPSDFGMTLFPFRDSIYLTTISGIYRYDDLKAKFIPSRKLSSILGDHFYRKVTVDNDGNLWYFRGSGAGVARLQEDGSYLDITVPFKPISKSFIGGFEFVYPHDPQNVFFGTENGFVHYDPSIPKDYTWSIKVYIRMALLSSNDSLLYRGIIDSSYALAEEIGFKNNDIQLFFSSNDFENPNRLEYSSFLSGIDEAWSKWDSQSNRGFTNLREGDYVFSVKARNIYNVESKPVTFSFTISPPWRRSLMAFLLYGLMILLATFVGILLIRRKINYSRREAELEKERQFRHREEELERASLESEKEVIRLRNEKLKEEMVQKDKELANSTLQMIQKNKFLVSLKDDLNRLSTMSQDQEFKSQIRILTRKINRDIDTDSQWKVFETHFEGVHEEFLKRIKEKFPGLSPRELKLCAYLRLNISSKEIALLMNISTRGVEISRYRLRKKLNLDRDTNLTEFIMSF